MPELSVIEEEFAQAIARGMKVGAAYAQGHPNASKKTCSENGSKMARSAKVAPRIIEIRQLAAQVGEKATKKAVEGAAKKLAISLLTMNDRRVLMAQIAKNSKVDPEIRMRAAMNDAKLAGELIEKTDLVTDGQPLPSAMPAIIVQAPKSFENRRSDGRN